MVRFIMDDDNSHEHSDNEELFRFFRESRYEYKHSNLNKLAQNGPIKYSANFPPAIGDTTQQSVVDCGRW